MQEKGKALCEKLFLGEIKISKRELWLISLVCLFGGIAYGLLKAPFTHGVTIGSHNGNDNGNKRGNSYQVEEELPE